MEVRHNTALLEQALALVVQRASIPSQQAEAEAAERIARAVARRRIATGVAIAVAAVGLGLGIQFGLWRLPSEGRVVSLPPAQSPSPVVPSPILPKTEPLPDRTVTEPKVFDPHAKVVDYEKFVYRKEFVGGRQWEVAAGHHYATDTDKVWSNAWCYTSQSADGILVKIDLAVRDSPSGKPRGPLASPESLKRVGLDDSSALDLATKCPWLDGKEYQASDFDAPISRGQPPTPQFVPTPDRQPEPVPASPPAPAYVTKDGFDLPGGDLSNMPLNSDTPVDCEASCNATNACVAYVFNKSFKKCFLKSETGTLITDDQAYTGYKKLDRGQPRISPLIMYKQTALVGPIYREIDNLRYVDCTVECDKDFSCLGFNYSTTRRCVMLKQISNTIPMPTVSSGIKSPSGTGYSAIPMVGDGGTFKVPVTINGQLTLNFVVDSGASDVCIPADIVQTLKRTETITDADFLDKQTYYLADGSTLPSQRFVIRSLKIGDKTLENVVGAIVPVAGGLLLGQSFLSRFKSWSIDNHAGTLILN
jgi:gag-polyprotein putative aspartyl protease/PAN domain